MIKSLPFPRLSPTPRIAFHGMLIIALGCAGSNEAPTSPSPSPPTKGKSSENPSVPALRWEEVQGLYGTLTPLFEGLFLTTGPIDTSALSDLNKEILPPAQPPIFAPWYREVPSTKWGVIDSTGRVVVPFICDGIRALSEHQGMCSVFRSAYSLNTGIPRYRYFGSVFLFTRAGIIPQSQRSFEMTTVFVGDFHRPEFVIEQGANYYLPPQY